MKAASIYSWLLSAFLFLSLTPLLGTGWYFLRTYENALRQTVADNLVQIANKKYDQIDNYLQERYADIGLLSKRPIIKYAIADFSKLWQEQGPQSQAYHHRLESTDQIMLSFLESGNYYDLLLIDTEGNVLYSIVREPDLQSNLFTGPYRTSKLAEGVETALSLLQTNQTMFAPYAPSKGRDASFLTAPVIRNGVLIGAVAVQLNWDRLQSVVTDRTGLGISGETVLAQRDGNEILFTAPLRYVEDAAFRYRVPIDSAPAPMLNALNGESGYGILINDYAEHSVVAAWRYLPSLQWGMVVKIDADEAFAPLERMQQITLSVLGILTGLICLLAVYFGNSLSKPLRSLMRATTHMARRDFRIRAHAAGPRELRELAASFNKMSNDLADLYLNLEVKVRERDKEIEARKSAESALIEAKDAAEAANRAKSVFLANMSHELRTPLNAILGFAQLMEHDESLSPDHRQNLATINRSGNHLLALINDVLEISRIEAGRTRIQNEAFSLAELLETVEDMIRVRAELKGLRFGCIHGGGIPQYVMGDQHHLRQILLNLLSNAVKYTAHGSVVLHVQKEHDGIRFEVADSGIGISAEDLPQIFQAFYQTAVGANKGEGAGLGLTITREFVHLMGGKISVSSEPGNGSTFTFTLPLRETDAPPVSATPRRIIGLAGDQLPVRVLVAEDDADSRELIKLILDRIGAETLIVENGQQAIEQFHAWHPQFIWMDMRMPVLDGYEATKAIRALQGGTEVKIVALTASAFREDKPAILAAGCDAILAKPVDEQCLFQTMGKLLGLRYRYADDETAIKQKSFSQDSLDLSQMNAELRAELANAAELLDAEAVVLIIERLRPDHPELAEAIAAWTEVYRFDVIARLCRTGNESETEL